MIEFIKLKSHHWNDYVGFKVIGHADSAPHGQDLVCAAVSATVGGTLLYLDKIHIPLAKMRMSSGDVKVIIDVEPNMQTLSILDMLFAQIQYIINSTPKRYVVVKEEIVE